ncbi:MAG: hypothetical protein DMG13_33230 [Acidobacteria bacterium]|nr:MAG: hypothetical protein DMG13_33230 [Acidobacteriota bacterium]
MGRNAEVNPMRDSRLLTIFVLILILATDAGRTAAQVNPAASQTGFHLLEATIEDIHAAFRSKRITCRELVNLYLKRIEAYDKVGPRLNTVQTVNSQALQEADRLDAAFASSGPVGSLHCIPVLLKDQVETSDMPTTYGSVIFKEFTPRRDATITTKMKKAGAIILAKTNMGEFAAGYIGSAFGVVRNAYVPARSPPALRPILLLSASRKIRVGRYAVQLRSTAWWVCGRPYHW